MNLNVVSSNLRTCFCGFTIDKSTFISNFFQFGTVCLLFLNLLYSCEMIWVILLRVLIIFFLVLLHQFKKVR